MMPEDLRASQWSWGPEIFSQLSPQPDDGPGLNMRARVDKKRLADTLRHNQTLKYLVLWTGYTTQQLLDSVATIANLERLEIGHLRAADISGLAKLERLEYLSIVSLSSASSLQPLTKLKRLVSLDLGVSSKITSLGEFAKASMPRLRAFQFGGSSDKPAKVDSLTPLRSLQSLEYVSLCGLRSEDDSLTALLDLPQLKALEVDANARFAKSDIDALRAKGARVSET